MRLIRYLGLLSLIFTITSLSAESHGDVAEALSEGSARLWGAEACTDGDATKSLEAVQSSYRCLTSSEDPLPALRQVNRLAISNAEDGFFASLALQHSKELDCSADFAKQMATTAKEGRADIKLRLQILREAKQRLVNASMALAKPEVSNKTCPLSAEDLRPNPMDVAVRGKDLNYELCKEIILSRTAYETIYHSIPLSGTPSVTALLEKFANIEEGERLRDLTNNLDSVIAKSYDDATSLLKKSAGEMKTLGSSNGWNIDRATRYGLMSDPLVVKKVIAGAGAANEQAMNGIACHADQRFYSGADALDRNLLIGSVVVSGGASVLVRAGTVGARLASGANAARAGGFLSLNAAKVIEYSSMSLAGGMTLASGISLLQRSCFANGYKAQGSDFSGQCVSAPTVEQLQQDSCVTGLALSGMGFVTALSPLLVTGAKAAASLVRAASPMTTEARVSSASTLLSRPLTQAQGRAVQTAHEVGAGQSGKDGTAALIGNYTPTQLREKTQILRGAGFNETETRLLMEKGLVGDVAVASPSPSFAPTRFSRPTPLNPRVSSGSLPAVWEPKTLSDFDKFYDVAKKTKAPFRKFDDASVPVTMPEIQGAITQMGFRGAQLVPKISTESGKVVMTYSGSLRDIKVNLNVSNGQNYYTIQEIDAGRKYYLKLNPKGNGRDGAGWTGLQRCDDMPTCHYKAGGFQLPVP